MGMLYCRDDEHESRTLMINNGFAAGCEATAMPRRQMLR